MDSFNDYNFALCDVVWDASQDTSEGYRIKVRIPGTDDPNTKTEQLPYCWPLLPKLLLVNPKKGEKVLVFFQKHSPQSFRAFIGPIMMQDYMLNYAPGSTSDGRTMFDANTLSRPDQVKEGEKTTEKLMGPFEAPSRNANNEGSVPSPSQATNAIILRGRANTDIIQKDNETQIRCGYMVNPYDQDPKLKLNYNSVDPGYIQLRYKKSKDQKGEEFKSNINIVADRINLLSYDSPSYIEKLGEKELVDDEKLEQIFQKAHPLPYGDELVAFLKEFVRVFKEHSHPFHQEPPCLSSANTDAISGNLEDMLSKSIRIN